MEYLRVPVTDEKAPKSADFAVLAGRAWNPPPGAALVFNCQMGRGRTTTGMIIASLLFLRQGVRLCVTPAAVGRMLWLDHFSRKDQGPLS